MIPRPPRSTRTAPPFPYTTPFRSAGRHRVRLPRELVLVTKQILYFERYAKELAPGYQILSDPRLLTYLLPQYEVPVQRPVLTTRPRTRPLDGDPEAGLLVEAVRDDRFGWDSAPQRPELDRKTDGVGKGGSAR